MVLNVVIAIIVHCKSIILRVVVMAFRGLLLDGGGRRDASSLSSSEDWLHDLLPSRPWS